MPTPAEIQAIRAALRRGDVSRLDRVAAAREELIAALFLASMEQVSGAVDVRALEQALERGDERALLDLMPSGELASAARVLARGVRPTLAGGADAGLAQIVAQIGGKAGKADSARLARWLTRYRRQLGVYLVRTAEDSALEILRNQVGAGKLSPKAAARAIKDGLGLSVPNAKALAIKAGAWEQEGRTAAEIADRLRKERAKLLGDRAQLFGRESSYQVAQQGQLEAWREKLEAGVIAPESKRFWGTRQDDRVCPVCDPMNGQGRVLGRKFRSTEPNGLGENTFDSPGPPPYGPHNFCRCYVVLVAVAGERRAA